MTPVPVTLPEGWICLHSSLCFTYAGVHTIRTDEEIWNMAISSYIFGVISCCVFRLWPQFAWIICRLFGSIFQCDPVSYAIVLMCPNKPKRTIKRKEKLDVKRRGTQSFVSSGWSLNRSSTFEGASKKNDSHQTHCTQTKVYFIALLWNNALHTSFC